MRRFGTCFVLWFGIGGFSPVYADSYKVYNSTSAVSYATTNYNTAYGGGAGQNPFHDYSGLAGGNCTNFVSQAIMGGLVPSSNMATVYGQRTNYDIDITSVGYQWYYVSDASRGPAFTGANKLYEYAVNNDYAYKGLHFDYVTNDTLTEFMDYGLVKKGGRRLRGLAAGGWHHRPLDVGHGYRPVASRLQRGSADLPGISRRGRQDQHRSR